METTDDGHRERFTGQVTTDGFDPTPRDMTFSTSTIRNLATEAPGTRNDASIESYGAAVLALGSKKNAEHGVYGTAVMVAPGIALTAKHVLDTYRAANGGSIDAGIHLFGARNGAIIIWEVVQVVLNEPNDIAILIVHPLTALPPGNVIDVLALTAGLRAAGEPLELFGFRAEQPTETKGRENIFHLAAYLSAGAVGEIYPERRDSVICPFPCLEIGAGAVGGMSGGPAFVATGECCGLISTSIGGYEGPTYVSLLWPVLTIPFQPIWPPGLYRQPVTLKGLSDSSLATLVESFRVGTLRMYEWIDPEVQFRLDGHLTLHHT